ncbi:MAG: hypothetical protein K0R59_189 [Sphingobacterium sp.]|jgi:hypothetical protein|nr:hypothetical protein [Sphingobacterium sp.]
MKIGAITLLSVSCAILGCRKELVTSEAPLSGLKQLASANISGKATLFPIADVYVQDGTNSNTNFGSNAWLIAKDDAAGYRREIYLRFDLASLPTAGATIQTATIELAGGIANAADTANAKWLYYTVSNNNWDEKAINWNNAPGTVTKLGEVSGKVKSSTSVVSFDIPAGVLLAALNADKKLSVKIVAQRNTAGSLPFYSDFQSKESPEIQLRPKLTISYSTSNSAYYRNLLMDKKTFDSIQLDLKSSAQAQGLINSQVTSKANATLLLKPNPVSKISDLDGKNRVQDDAAQVYALGLQYFLFQGNTGAEQYLAKAKEFLLAWAAVNSAISQTPDESMYLPFLTGYSLVRQRLDANSQLIIDNWLRTRYNFYKIQQVRTNNWETIRNLLMLDIAFILNDGQLIDQASKDFTAHHNKNYRADGASVDFLGRDAFAYHVYDMEFMGQIGRTLYIHSGRRSAVDSLVYHRSSNWSDLRTNMGHPPVLGGSLADAVSFMAPYVMDPANNVHLEFVHTEWAPDKNRSDYNKPYGGGGAYAFVQLAALMKDEMFTFLKKNNPAFTRYTDLKYYINSFQPSAVTPYPPTVTLYGNMAFHGWYKDLSVGRYAQADLFSLGVSNDQLSSVRIPAGYRVTLYENDNFTGNSISLNGNTIDLSTLKFNDQTSSIVIERL